jgi:vacuolar-type H+-ATPase subunit H
MKKIKIMALMLSGSTFLFTPGCLTTETEKVEEPTIAAPAQNGDQPEVITEDIEVIAQEDTTGRVSAAEEAADKLIADAKREAASIKQAADKIMATKTYEAEKKAEEIIASMTSKVKDQKAKTVKLYLQEKKAEAEKKADEIIAAAKKKAAAIKAEAQKSAESFKEKTKHEYDKITKQILENSRKAAADLTAKGSKEALKIRDASKKLFKEAKAYTDKQKKAAEEYLQKKMKEADLAMAKISEKIKKNKDLEKGAKPALADKMLVNIMRGMRDDNYKDFTENFTRDLKTNFTEKKFKALNAQLKGKIGDYKKRYYLGSLQKGPLRVYLWKGIFSNAKNNDLVIRLTIGELDGKDQVYAFDISNL